MSPATVGCAACSATLRPEAAFCPSCGARVGARPRLNPFVLPTETDSRFLLLLIAVAGASTTIFTMIYNTVPGNWAAFKAAEHQCRALQGEAAARGEADVGMLFAQCMARGDQSRAIWIVGGIVALLAVAALIFAAIPQVLVWRHQLQPLADRPAGIHAELAALCQAAGIRPMPTFVQHRFFRGARVFGWRGRYVVAMGRALADSCATNPRLFRAVVRHELAHLRNGDVEKTYFTLALCIAFALVCLLPLAVLLLDNPLALSLQFVWRALALVGLVALVGASVLRARETYADVRASVWDEPGGALCELLDQQLARSALKRWHPLQLHPASAARRSALEHPERLFETSFWELFGVGAASTVALVEVALLLVDPLVIVPLLRWGWATLLIGVAASVLVALPVFGVVGAAIWRATFARLAGYEVRWSLWGAALALGAGMLAGLKLSFFGAALAQIEPPSTWFGLAVFDLIWCGALVACLALVFSWTATSAAAWLPVTLARPARRPVPRVALVAGSGLLISITGVFGLVYLLRLLALLYDAFVVLAPQYGETLPEQPVVGILMVAGAALVVFILSPLTTVGLALLAWYPLAASGKTNVRALPSWALLEPAGAELQIKGAALQPRVALQIGAVGGLINAALALLAFVLMPRPDGEFAGLGTALTVGLLALTVVVQPAVALLAAARAPGRRLLHGLGAAEITGITAFLSIVGLLWLGGVLSVEGALVAAALSFNIGGVVTLVLLGATRLVTTLGRRAGDAAPSLFGKLRL